jgi:hypothetical protein
VAQGEEEVVVVEGQPPEHDDPPALPAEEPVVHENHEDAFEALSDALMPYRTEDPAPGTAVLTETTPGIGKTRVGLHLARMKAIDDQRGMWAASTRDIAWQAHDRLKTDEWGAQVLMLEGRHSGYTRTKIDRDGTKTEREMTPNCLQHHKIARARQKGYPARTYVCNGCPHCPTHKDADGEKPPKDMWCRYFKVFYEACNIASGNSMYGAQYAFDEDGDEVRPTTQSKIIVATHHMMAAMVADGEMLEPDWMICDEDPISALRETYEWDETELERDVDGDEHGAFRVLLARTITIAKQFLSESPFGWGQNGDPNETRRTLRLSVHRATEYGYTTLWGIDLARFLWIAARQLGLNLKHLLEDAAAAPPVIVPGEMFYIRPHKFERLPHFKETDLASELLRIVETAEEGDQVAYKVSLRKEPNKQWGFVWDHVRRINYDGPLFFLDAYGSPEIIRRYTNRTITPISVRCKVRENVTVRWYPHVGTNRAQMDDVDERQKLFDDYLLPELQRAYGKRVLIYTQKRYAEWLEQKIREEGDTVSLQALTIKWFWQDRGDDSFADYHKLIVFGTPIPNVIAEQQFANALYAGEEPLSWVRDSDGEYLDIRAKEHCAARQQKELLQCLYRLRLALPNPTPQEVVVFSKMKLPLELELNGAEHHSEDKGRWNIGQFQEPMQDCFEQLGCWLDSFAAFVGVHQEFIAWAKGEQDALPFNYVQMKRRHKRILRTPEYRRARWQVLERIYDQELETLEWRGNAVHYYGDRDKAIELMDRLRKATREPGCDDEDVRFRDRGPGSTDIATRYIPEEAWRLCREIEAEVDTIKGRLFFSGQWHFGDWLPPEAQQQVDELYMDYPMPGGVHWRRVVTRLFEQRGFTNIPAEVNQWREFIRTHGDVFRQIMEETAGLTEAPDLDEFEEEPAVTPNVISLRGAVGDDQEPAVPGRSALEASRGDFSSDSPVEGVSSGEGGDSGSESAPSLPGSGSDPPPDSS